MPVNHLRQRPSTAPLREAGHTDQFFALSITLHQHLFSKFDIRLDPTPRTVSLASIARNVCMKPPREALRRRDPESRSSLRGNGASARAVAVLAFWRFADARQMQQAMLLMIVHDACVEVQSCTEFTCLPVSLSGPGPLLFWTSNMTDSFSATPKLARMFNYHRWSIPNRLPSALQISAPGQFAVGAARVSSRQTLSLLCQRKQKRKRPIRGELDSAFGRFLSPSSASGPRSWQFRWHVTKNRRPPLLPPPSSGMDDARLHQPTPQDIIPASMATSCQNQGLSTRVTLPIGDT